MCGGGGSMGVGVSAFVRVFERERETHQTFHVYSGKVFFFFSEKKPISGNLLLLHSFMNAKNRPNISFHAPLPRRKHVNFTGTDGRAQTPYTSDQMFGRPATAHPCVIVPHQAPLSVIGKNVARRFDLLTTHTSRLDH